VRKHGLS